MSKYEKLKIFNEFIDNNYATYQKIRLDNNDNCLRIKIIIFLKMKYCQKVIKHFLFLLFSLILEFAILLEKICSSFFLTFVFPFSFFFSPRKEEIEIISRMN